MVGFQLCSRLKYVELKVKMHYRSEFLNQYCRMIDAWFVI